MKQLLIALSLLSLTGCAAVFQGTTDTLNVKALGATQELTKCSITDGKANYSTLGKSDIITVDRGINDLVISCENEDQSGELTVPSDFQQMWLVADIMWDACIITLSCPIDLISGAFFDYPNDLHIEMYNKDGSANYVLDTDKAIVAKELKAKRAAERANNSNNKHSK